MTLPTILPVNMLLGSGCFIIITYNIYSRFSYDFKLCPVYDDVVLLSVNVVKSSDDSSVLISQSQGMFG